MSSYFNPDNGGAPQIAAADPAGEALGAETPAINPVSPGLGPVVVQAAGGRVLPDLTLLELEQLLSLDPTDTSGPAGRSFETDSFQPTLGNAELPADLTSLDLDQLLELELAGSQLPTILEVAGLSRQAEEGDDEEPVDDAETPREAAETFEGEADQTSLPEQAQAADEARDGDLPGAAGPADETLLDTEHGDEDDFEIAGEFDLEAAFEDDSPPSGPTNVGAPGENPSGEGQAGSGQGNGPGSNNGQGAPNQANGDQSGGQGGEISNTDSAGGEPAQADSGSGDGSNNGQGNGSNVEIAAHSNAGGNSANNAAPHSNAGGSSATAGGGALSSNAGGDPNNNGNAGSDGTNNVNAASNAGAAAGNDGDLTASAASAEAPPESAAPGTTFVAATYESENSSNGKGNGNGLGHDKGPEKGLGNTQGKGLAKGKSKQGTLDDDDTAFDSDLFGGDADDDLGSGDSFTVHGAGNPPVVSEPATATASSTSTVSTTSANDAPAAVTDTASSAEDTAVIVSVLSNDSDPENDPLTITAVTQGANGAVADNGDGTITYTPNANYSGADSFTYSIEDGNGGTDTTTVDITVTPVNDAPEAVDENASTAVNTAVVVAVLSNDGDIDLDTLTITAVSQGANGTAVDNGDGTVTYTPNAGYSGVDSFTYTIDDGNGGTDIATVTVTVTGANAAPVATDDAAATDVDAAVIVSVLGNDSDPNSDPLAVSAVTQGANGTVVNNGDGTVTYTPNAGYAGADTFAYTANDGAGGTDTATVTVFVGTATEGTAAGETIQGSSGADVIFGHGGDDTLQGKNGDDVLHGGDGNDTLNGQGGSDQLFGDAGDDILLWSLGDASIDGGSGTDTLDGGGQDIDLTAFAGTISGIEAIDVTASGSDQITLTAQDVLDMSDTDTLTLLGGPPDTLDAGSGWTDGGVDGSGNQIYTQVVGGDTATLVVDPNISVNGDILV